MGATRTGKSHLARKLFLSSHAPRLVIDPADSELTDIPGAVTFSDPTKATNEQGQRWTDAATARFVPEDDPQDPAVYEPLYAWCFNRFPRMIWLDEAGMAMPARGGSRAARRYLVQGAKRRLGHIACHTRPRDIDRNLISQAQHLFVFDLPNVDDRRHIAEQAGIPAATLEAEMRQLPQFGFLWWRQLERRLIVCPPLTA